VREWSSRDRAGSAGLGLESGLQAALEGCDRRNGLKSGLRTEIVESEAGTPKRLRCLPSKNRTIRAVGSLLSLHPIGRTPSDHMPWDSFLNTSSADDRSATGACGRDPPDDRAHMPQSAALDTSHGCPVSAALRAQKRSEADSPKRSGTGWNALGRAASRPVNPEVPKNLKFAYLQ